MSRRIRCLVSAAVTVVASSFAAPAAGAAIEATLTCDAFLVEPDGSSGDQVATDVSNPLDVHSWTGPATVNAHTGFAFADEGGTWSLPSESEGPSGPVAIEEYKDVVFDYEIAGAASVDSATLAGGDVVGATATVVAPDHVEVELPGTQDGSASPGGTRFVPPPFVFTPPVVTVGVTAGDEGSAVTALLVGLEFTQTIDGGSDPDFSLRIACTASATLATTAVAVAAPPDTTAAPALPRTGTASGSTAMLLAGLAAVFAGSILAITGRRLLPRWVHREH